MIFLTGIFSLCFFNFASAYSSPNVYVTQLNVSEINSDEIKGDFVIWNSEDYFLNDLNYSIQLLQGTGLNQQKTIDTQVVAENFFVAPGQKITKKFDYKYPQNIDSGKYILRIQPVDNRGGLLSWEDKTISLDGKNNFLKIVSPLKLSINGNENPPTTGETASATDKITAVLTIKNPGNEITATPTVKVYNRMYNMSLAKEFNAPEITFAKGETKEIEIDMPKLETPESYLAEVKLFLGNDQISPIQYFRWVVAGESGKILSVKSDKDYYAAGENIVVTVDSVGPADGSDAGTATLQVNVYDGKGNLSASVSKEVKLNSYVSSSKISIANKKDLVSPKFEVKLIKDGKVLDRQGVNLPLFSDQAKRLQKKVEITKIVSGCVLVFIILVALVLVYIFRKKIFFFKLWKKGN